MTATQDTYALVSAYYAAFNRQDLAGMLALLAEDVLHEPSQGTPRAGKALFADFLAHMNHRYRETVIDPVVLASSDGSRAAAEFTLDGQYLQTDEGLPAARGQGYRLRVGAFFEIVDGRIARVSNHYNLNDWIAQVEAG
ncbi:MAG: nuclear transport factor 2 family protein [Novosphingobium sp.]|jgi:steroid delta-isomerase-like uncharacterized protein|nr:nuclear transport factor 2 family protein [Novosphingobium sp.]